MFAALPIHQIPISTAPPSLRRFPKPSAISCAARSDSLDHLQRATKQPPPQEPAPPPPIRRRATPVGLWGQIPAARTVQQMMDTMERLMEDPLFSESEVGAASGGLNGYRRGGRTPWEIREADAEYRMRFDMPGMTKRDVRLWVEEGMLVIKAEKEEQPAASAATAASPREGERRDWTAKSFGRYSSRIALPENAVVEKIAAEVRDGVLYVTVPKAAPTSKVLDIAVQ